MNNVRQIRLIQQVYRIEAAASFNKFHKAGSTDQRINESTNQQVSSFYKKGNFEYNTEVTVFDAVHKTNLF